MFRIRVSFLCQPIHCKHLSLIESTTSSVTSPFLVRLAIDVYNDSLVETKRARSWPSRSRSFEYANSILDKFDENGWDTVDISFNTSSSMCHYRSPHICRNVGSDSRAPEESCTHAKTPQTCYSLLHLQA